MDHFFNPLWRGGKYVSVSVTNRYNVMVSFIRFFFIRVDLYTKLTIWQRNFHNTFSTRRIFNFFLYIDVDRWGVSHTFNKTKEINFLFGKDFRGEGENKRKKDQKKNLEQPGNCFFARNLKEKVIANNNSIKTNGI